MIVPVFDGVRYLAEALASALAQGPALREVLVVDDGSTDGSAAVARGFGGIVRVISQENRGLSAARNRGIAEATGPYLAFLDSDDLWVPDSLPARLAALTAEPALDLVLGLAEQFICPRADPAATARLKPRPGWEPGVLCPAMLCRREVFARVGGFDEALRGGEFVDWYSRARDAGLRAEVLPVPCLRRRLHGANLTLRHAGLGRDYLGIVKARLARRRAAAPPAGDPPP